MRFSSYELLQRLRSRVVPSFISTAAAPIAASAIVVPTLVARIHVSSSVVSTASTLVICAALSTIVISTASTLVITFSTIVISTASVASAVFVPAAVVVPASIIRSAAVIVPVTVFRSAAVFVPTAVIPAAALTRTPRPRHPVLSRASRRAMWAPPTHNHPAGFL